MSHPRLERTCVGHTRLGCTRLGRTRLLRKHVLALGFFISMGSVAIAPHTHALPLLDSERANATFSETTQSLVQFSAQSLAQSPAESLDLEPAILENSPVLQRWIEEVPDVLSDIEQDPSFRTRLRAGYRQNWSDGDGGIMVGVDDIFVGRTGVTVSGDYWTELDEQEGDRQEQYGVDMQYYLLPLGHKVNVAPVFGYRHVDWGREETDGANVGIRFRFMPSRSGAADVSLAQTWVDPGGDRTLSRFTLSVGYALTQNLRLSTDFQVQTSESRSQTDTGLLLEWQL